MELQDIKDILASENATYLAKTAALVDGYATEIISAEEANNAASAVGVDLQDLRDLHDAKYGDINKEASDAAVETDAVLREIDKDPSQYGTLVKSAAISDGYALGLLDAEQGGEVAHAWGVDSRDVDLVTDLMSDELTKSAAEYAYDGLTAVFAPTDLQKAASIAGAYMSGSIGEDDANQIIGEQGVDADDVNGMMALMKEAGTIGDAAGATKDFFTKNFKKGIQEMEDRRGMIQDVKDSAANKFTKSSLRNKVIKRQAKREIDHIKKTNESGLGQLGIGAAKALGAAGALGATGYGATKGVQALREEQ